MFDLRAFFEGAVLSVTEPPRRLNNFAILRAIHGTCNNQFSLQSNLVPRPTHKLNFSLRVCLGMKLLANVHFIYKIWPSSGTRK